MIFGCKPQSSVFIFNDVADCFSFQVLFPIICYQVVEIVFGQAGVTDPSEESADPHNVTPAFINSIDRIGHLLHAADIVCSCYLYSHR